MAATISANSAGGGGLVTSGDASGVLKLQTAGVTALSISAAQVVSFINPVTLTSATLTSATLTSATLTTPTINSAQVPTVSGTAPLYMCRAWVNFDGTLASPITPRASGNTSSVTKSSTALYTINFTTAMPDANYSIVGAGGVYGASAANATLISTNPINTTSCFIGTRNGANADTAFTSVSVSIFR